MKTASSDLFDLIHSLTKSEKRFFKLSPSEAGEMQYMRLFDIIEAQSKYNEKAALEKLQLNKNTFAVKKKYLHDLILNRMASLHFSMEASIRTLLTQADFLYSKGLYAQEKKVLQKAKALAERSGLKNYLLEILQMEYWLCWKDMELPQAEALLKERNEVFSLITNENDLHNAEGQLTLKISKTGDKTNALKKEEFSAIINSQLLAKESNALSFDAKQSFYNIFCSYHVVLGDLKKGYFFGKKLVDLFLSEPEKAKYKAVSFLIALSNLIHLCNELKMYDEEKAYLKILSDNSALLKAEHERSWAFFTFNHSSLVYYIRTGKFEEAVPVAERIQTELLGYEKKLDGMLTIVLNFKIAQVWYGAGKFSKCLQLMNRIKGMESSIDARPDLQCAIRIFLLIVHFEKGNPDLASRLARSERRIVASKKNLYRFESVMLDFFSTVGNKTNQPDPGKQFKQLKNAITALEENQQERSIMEEFDFVSWIDSKIEGKTFAEVIRKKART